MNVGTPSRPRFAGNGTKALMILSLLILSSCRYEEVETEIGYLGEAKRNPFLAAQRLCEESGYESKTQLTTMELPGYYTTLVLSSESVASIRSAQLIADWVAEGGSLIYFLDGASRFHEDTEVDIASFDRDWEEEIDPLLEVLEVQAVESGEGSGEFDFGGEVFDVEMPSDVVFEAEWVYDEEDFFGHRDKVFEFLFGDGLVYLVSDARPFRNRQIGKKDHAAFLMRLLEETENYSVVFVIGARVSFFAMLVSRGWMVLLPIVLALAVWIWKSLPRFGPILPDDPASGRKFSAHVDTLGKFLWRQRSALALLAPVRRRIAARLRVNQARGEEDLLDEAHLAGLSDRTGLPLERLQSALQEDPGREPARFFQISRDLQTIEQNL
ncbi:MAG: DUF4350 domain-containing protein [Verrucomicrobiota bacterium]